MRKYYRYRRIEPKLLIGDDVEFKTHSITTKNIVTGFCVQNVWRRKKVAPMSEQIFGPHTIKTGMRNWGNEVLCADFCGGFENKT